MCFFPVGFSRFFFSMVIPCYSCISMVFNGFSIQSSMVFRILFYVSAMDFSMAEWDSMEGG